MIVKVGLPKGVSLSKLKYAEPLLIITHSYSWEDVDSYARWLPSLFWKAVQGSKIPSKEPVTGPDETYA